MFRYINIFYGDLLEQFMKSLSYYLEVRPTDLEGKSRNEVGFKAKFSKYQRPISLTDVYGLKTYMYLGSWLFKILLGIWYQFSKCRGKIGGFQFYASCIHKRLHNGLFNVFLTSGAFHVTKTILFVKAIPDNFKYNADNVLSLICFTVMLIDFKFLLQAPWIPIHAPYNKVSEEVKKSEKYKNFKTHLDKAEGNNDEPVSMNVDVTENNNNPQKIELGKEEE